MNKQLNSLLANQVVFYHKLQSYHWYVSGHSFYQMHEMLESLYDQVRDHVDEVAEAALMIGEKPVSRMTEFLDLATIEESKGDYVGRQEVFESVKADFEQLLKQVKSVKAAAEEAGQDLVAIKMDAMIEDYSKNIWMLAQSLRA